jgi:hypothetical protein
MELPTWNYATKTRQLIGQEKERCEPAEIKFLRSVAVFTLLDFRRNTGIRNNLYPKTNI